MRRAFYQRRCLELLLERRALTTVETARLLGVDKRAFSKWMTGVVTLPPYWIARLRIVLDLSDAEVVSLLTAAALVQWDRGGGLSPRPHPLAPPVVSPASSSGVASAPR